MKTSMLICCLLAIMTLNSYASDLLVEEFGLAPAYSSISAAVAAANDGDRIIIKNKNGNAPWIENVTVNKSVQFLPFTNDTFFIVQGIYTIVPADNREITIVGMRNMAGNITGSAVANVAARTKVNIMGSLFQSGSVLISANGYNVNTVHTIFANGGVSIRAGSVIGCDITMTANSSGIAISPEIALTSETIKIIGNKINNSSVTTGAYGIAWTSGTHFFDIRNNLVYTRNVGIIVSRSRVLNTVSNRLNNNTVSITGSTTTANAYGINILTTSANSIVEVMNNLVDLNSTSSSNIFGITNVSAVPSVTFIYNTVDEDITAARRTTGNFSTNSNNNFAAVVLAPDGNIQGAGGLNMGNPSAPYYDLDLTVNDCGAYGGGFSLKNYFPIHAGAARIYMVTVPANVRVGGTISIQADGYDR
jgi:hypothetical protein